MKPRVRRIAISDDGLRCFIQWARLNTEDIVLDPVIARNVLQAYAGVASAIDPGVAIAERLAADKAPPPNRLQQMSRAVFDPGLGLRP